LAPGDLFVALKDQRDGHDFVSAACAKGAVAALVRDDYPRQAGDGLLIRVDNPLRALERLAIAARARLSSDARVVAVTGSAGKTTTKEMLRICLGPMAQTHASAKSFNNHWGVPLTLASMPSSARFGVFEIGMNHAGEVTPLTRMVRPHAAIVTNVLPVHLGQFASVDEIAHAKAEIFAGLDATGTAVINADLPRPHVAILETAALQQGAKVIRFGEAADADVRLAEVELGPDASGARAVTPRGAIAFRVGAAGRHLVLNALAVIAALQAIGIDDVQAALAPLASMSAGSGRGARSVHAIGGGRLLLIDESYNANPASMRVALSAMALIPRERFARRIAVLGDMLELGPQSEALHAALASDAAQNADLVFAAGSMMQVLFDALPAAHRGVWAGSAAELREAFLNALGQATWS